MHEPSLCLLQSRVARTGCRFGVLGVHQDCCDGQIELVQASWKVFLEHDSEKMTNRIPAKANIFERFRDKQSCKAKDYAIEIATKMYRLDCVNRKEILSGNQLMCDNSLGVNV